MVRGLSLPEKMYRQIDELRKDVPRSTYIRRILEEKLDVKGQEVKGGKKWEIKGVQADKSQTHSNRSFSDSPTAHDWKWDVSKWQKANLI